MQAIHRKLSIKLVTILIYILSQASSQFFCLGFSWVASILHGSLCTASCYSLYIPTENNMYEYVILNSSDFPKEICSLKFKAMGTRPIFHFATSDNVLTVEASPKRDCKRKYTFRFSIEAKNNLSWPVSDRILPVLHLTCPALHLTCPASTVLFLVLPCIWPVPHLFCPASDLSCIRPVLHQSCLAAVLYCLRPVLHFTCPARVLYLTNNKKQRKE